MNTVVRQRLVLALLLGASAASATLGAILPLYCDVVSSSCAVYRNRLIFNAITRPSDVKPQASLPFVLRETSREIAFESSESSPENVKVETAFESSRENVKLETASNWSADWLFSGERFAPLNPSDSNGLPSPASCPDGACPFASAPPTLAQKPTPPRGIVRSIVRVYNAYEEGVSPPNAPRGSARRRVVEKGSGAVVADSLGTRYVLTAAHIFRDGRGEIAAQTPDGRIFAASLVLASEECDVALLRVDVPDDVPALPISSSWPRQGETVWRAGFGPDETLKETSGVVKGYVKTDRSAAYETLKVNGPARQGDSGGPVYNAKGEIVGVVWGTDGVDAYATYCGRVLATLCDYSPTFAPDGAATFDDAPFAAALPPTRPRLASPASPPVDVAPRLPVDALKNDAASVCDAAPRAVATTKFRDYCNAALASALVFAFGYCGFFAGKQR